MMDQVEKVKKQGQSAAIIRANCSEADRETGIEVQGDSVENVLCGRVSIVFAHPEVLCSSKKCREMLLSNVYQRNVVCVVADEVHCIVDWRVIAIHSFCFAKKAFAAPLFGIKLKK